MFQQRLATLMVSTMAVAGLFLTPESGKAHPQGGISIGIYRGYPGNFYYPGSAGYYRHYPGGYVPGYAAYSFVGVHPSYYPNYYRYSYPYSYSRYSSPAIRYYSPAYYSVSGYPSSVIYVVPKSSVRAYYAPNTATSEIAPPPRMVPSAPAKKAVNITVRVPADAEIWFDGTKTSQTGASRQFVSPPLATDKSYQYEVKARWLEDGNEVIRTRRVEVQGGSRVNVDLTKSQKEDE